ncbi:MFS transporter [Nocardioides guangzhouensis]|uniref:MFS transporter n=1 Tax=Nocardioides guangzhouensis TaxID=2497878 RepID=A0A4Q4Z7N7_9ACTN|nr:MFS transporter [Nocardioides guangzhouensis]RYP83528.1 MFS transporter [Nocardioides guangzhouensis]
MTVTTLVDPVDVVPSRTTYRSLARAVDRRFLALGMAVRLPTAMLPLGILLYVADATGSFASGGLAVAALSIGGGIGGPVVGALADRFGQRPVLLASTAVQVLGIAAFLLLGDTLGPAMLIAALVGLANPQAGAMARARWSVVARRRPDRLPFTATAMAYEGAVDEASFVVGPVLVSTVAGLTAPYVGLGLALVLALVAQTGFALHPSSLPGRGRAASTPDVPRAPLPVAHLAFLLLAMAAVGVVFGSSQTGVAARMAESGHDGLTGPVYALMGVGSAVAGLLSTRLPARFALADRIAAGGALLVLGGGVVALAGPPPLLGLACLFLGLALAPALVSAYALAERAAPAGWGTTTMTALATANVVGVAAGAAVAGQLVDRVSPGAGLLVVSVAGLGVLACGLGARFRPLGRRLG